MTVIQIRSQLFLSPTPVKNLISIIINRCPKDSSPDPVKCNVIQIHNPNTFKSKYFLQIYIFPWQLIYMLKYD